MTSVDRSRALTFGQVADEYDRWRPGYPDDAVAWLAPPAPARVADVGAGTGKLSASLVARGLDVDAVEPDAAMLAVLTREVPAATPHQAPSDGLPFEDGSLDAVLVADAWHWLPVESTLTEVRRVLRPGGWLGAVWNLVTPVESWEFDIIGVDPDRKGSKDGPPVPPLPPGFTPDETDAAAFPWTWEITPEHYAAQLATNSAVILMDESDRQARLEQARCLLQRVCDETGRATLPLRHEATCFRWTPRQPV